MTRLWWHEVQTGGGCTALRADVGGYYWLITDEGGCSTPNRTERTELGYYTADGDELLAIDCVNLADAKRVAVEGPRSPRFEGRLDEAQAAHDSHEEE